MRFLMRLLGWLGVSAKVERTGACVVCGGGPSPALGVPMPTTDGTWKHLVCMTVGRQLRQATEEAAKATERAGSAFERSRPLVVAIGRLSGPEVWN